jgi:hypothetical protein
MFSFNPHNQNIEKSPMRELYRHTQTSPAFSIVIASAAFIGIFLMMVAHVQPSYLKLLFPFLLGVFYYLFHPLTVIVDEAQIHVRFGPGIIKRSFDLGQIAPCRVVRNKWWYGLGVKKIPGGRLYSISGLDAVELSLPEGRMVRIGSDEPQALAEAINTARENSPFITAS